MDKSENPHILLKSRGLRPNKKFGQNFLRNDSVIEKLVDVSNLTSGDTIVEIGAGLGAVTIQLAEKAHHVYAYEIDVNLLPLLHERIGRHSNVTVVPEDILDFNADKLGLAEYKAIGSIPYQITSPLIHKLLIQPTKPSLIVMLIQKEVAEKICAHVPDASYLSMFVSLFGTAEIVKIVKPSSFFPSPTVDSALIKITVTKKSDIDAPKWQAFLHHAFMQPRKMLNKRFDRKLLESAGIDPNRRAQTVTLEEWRTLFQAAYKD